MRIVSLNSLYYSVISSGRVRYGFQYFSSIGLVHIETIHIKIAPTKMLMPKGGIVAAKEPAAKIPELMQYCQMQNVMLPPIMQAQAPLALARLEYRPKIKGMKNVKPRMPKP